MKLLTSPKTTYLLDADIEILHEQSNEWLNEIAFWYDELSFLHSLVIKKTLKLVPVNAKNSIEKIENELIRLTGGELDRLKLTVETHEKLLGDILEKKGSTNEDTYREKHHQLINEFREFNDRLKLLKKDVFNLVKLIIKSEN